MINKLKEHRTDAILERFLDRYAANRRPISVQFRDIVDWLPSIDRATHLIHPYPAKLLVHIPIFFLSNELLSQPGDAVLDPFCGSGTVLLESLLAGRKAIGAELSPIARLITKVKTTPLDLVALERHASEVLARLRPKPKSQLPDVVNLKHWFYPETIDQLLLIRDAIWSIEDEQMRDFFSVCFSGTVRKVSLADPRLAVPVKAREGRYPDGHPLREKSDRRCRELRGTSVRTVFEETVAANLKRMAQLEPSARKLPDARIASWDAKCLRTNGHPSAKGIKDKSVRLIITSPPYPGAQKYIRSLSLNIGWLGMCASRDLLTLKRATIGREEFRKSEWQELVPTGVAEADRYLAQIYAHNPVRAAIASTYLTEMRECLREMYRVLTPGGHLVLVASNNQISGREFRTQEYLRRVAEELGFQTILRMVDAIRSRGLMTKRNRTAGVITREWILVFRKG